MVEANGIADRKIIEKNQLHQKLRFFEIIKIDKSLGWQTKEKKREDTNHEYWI